MATITELNIHPIKSCRGIALKEATLLESGLEYDRMWMVVDEAGQFMTQRQHPRMALIETELRLGQLVVRAPGMLRLDIPLEVIEDAPETWRTVRVWRDEVQAVDEGELCAAWFSRFLGTPCRLVKFHPEARRIANRQWTGGVEVAHHFADGYPLMLISQASLDDLNARLAKKGVAPVPMRRFRPNVVIDGVEAYEEDYLESLAVGGMVLKVVKPCTRCNIPNIDPATAEEGTEPGDTLQGYRALAKMDGAVCFGQNLIVTAGAGGRLAVGQPVETAIAF